MNRVVITGMAGACSAGFNHKEIFENLCKKNIILKKLNKDNPAKNNINLNYYVPFPEIDDSDFQNELKIVKKRGSKASYALAYTALKAVKDAEIQQMDYDTSVYIGTGAPVMQAVTESVISFNEKAKMDLMSLPKSMHSSVAAWVCMVLNTHGRSMELGAACASGIAAIEKGYYDIMTGQCKMSVCGGIDYLSDCNMTLMKGFEYLKAVSSDESGASFPFSQERCGFMFSEGGAGIIILEELEHAKKRNAVIYAEITGTGASSDAYSIVSMPEDGKEIKYMLTNLIGDKKVDYYNAHGTGTILNDTVEARVIKEIFGSKENQPAISSTKSIIGHTLGASGVIEAMVCVDSILNQKVHGSNCKTIMDDLNITSETRDIQIYRTVTASFGFGGHNYALMIEKYKE